MPLFVSRLPLYSWMVPSPLEPRRRWSVSLPVLVTASGIQAPPPDAVPQRWVLDTGFTGEAFAWRSHLEEAGLNPRVNLLGFSSAGSAFGHQANLPVRKATLWLLSNLPAFQATPFRMSLDPGIAFRDAAAPDSEFRRPLIGMRALLRAGLKVQIDFARATVSIWTPGPWHENLSLLWRRFLSGRARLPPPW